LLIIAFGKENKRYNSQPVRAQAAEKQLHQNSGIYLCCTRLEGDSRKGISLLPILSHSALSSLPLHNSEKTVILAMP